MFGFYKFENYYFGNITRMEPRRLEWEELYNDNYSYPTLLLKLNKEKYIDLFHENREILITRNNVKTCYVLNYVEPVGNYFPQDMLINRKNLTKEQAIKYFGDYLIEFDRKNSNKNVKKLEKK